MIVIADTTPIHYLVLIGEADLLPRLFGTVIVPQAVLNELEHPHTPPPVKAWLQAPPAWLNLRQADPAYFKLLAKLGAGETEALALALELNADAVLLDDKKARREAQAHTLTTISTLSLLEAGAQRGWLDLPAAIAKLEQTNFRFPAEMAEAMLKRDAERKHARQHS